MEKLVVCILVLVVSSLLIHFKKYDFALFYFGMFLMFLKLL